MSYSAPLVKGASITKCPTQASPTLGDTLPSVEQISMDFIEMLPKSKGFDTILVVVDRMTRFSHFITLAHRFIATIVARNLMDSMFKFMGCQGQWSPTEIRYSQVSFGKPCSRGWRLGCDCHQLTIQKQMGKPTSGPMCRNVPKVFVLYKAKELDQVDGFGTVVVQHQLPYSPQKDSV